MTWSLDCMINVGVLNLIVYMQLDFINYVFSVACKLRYMLCDDYTRMVITMITLLNNLCNYVIFE